MSKYISRLLSSSSNGPPATSTFSIRPSPHLPSHIVVHPLGYPADVPPIFTIVTSKSKPNVSVFRGHPIPENRIGDAIMHTFSSTINLNHRGQTATLREGSLSGNFTLVSPAGKFKWTVNQITGSGWELKDAAVMKLASMRSAGFPGSGERKLELFVPCDDLFLELIVLSAITAKTSQKDTVEAVGEVVGAVVGA
ncbi:hypothetical protein ONS95_004667 [Cadophora gregata]|uniref:uncharacterized protein n=1 Tax=Cadophora gregata TaxID=51156 RepID=UPI0026DDC4AF|nr:uncharacterized protein ONS95_004667 [Cadophora gregata]KAK0104371.1 hypothetical protein ONS95_004667 [Cadophora gregata]